MNLKTLMSKSLSNDEILKLLGGKANLLGYSDVHKYQTLDELLGPHQCCVVLYEAKKNYGHWCCIFRRGNVCEFFDPYGNYPDTILETIDKKFRQQSNQNYPYLCKLMIDSPYTLTYNEHNFQEYKRNINTCGRWVVCRLLFKHLPLKEFYKLFKKNRDYKPDLYATILTKDI